MSCNWIIGSRPPSLGKLSYNKFEQGKYAYLQLICRVVWINFPISPISVAGSIFH